MEVCAKTYQGHATTLRIHDNAARDGAVFKAIVHSGNRKKTLQVRPIPSTNAYEFDVVDDQAQMQVIEILVDDVAISTSPIRVQVSPFDCEASYPGERRDANEFGICGTFTELLDGYVKNLSYHLTSFLLICEVCSDVTREIGNKCIPNDMVSLIIFSIVFIFVAVGIVLHLGYRKKQNDLVWHIQPEELRLNDPPEVIGQGKQKKP